MFYFGWLWKHKYKLINHNHLSIDSSLEGNLINTKDGMSPLDKFISKCLVFIVLHYSLIITFMSQSENCHEKKNVTNFLLLAMKTFKWIFKLDKP